MSFSTITEPKDSMDYPLFVRRIKEKTGLDLGAYKRPQMERRLNSLVQQAGAKNFCDYLHLLEKDPRLMEAFRKRMTINVSELFRNPDRFAVLREKILPELTAKNRRLNIWSAGCSYGAEIYSVAMLLREMRPVGCSARLLASDIDEEMLARGKSGIFSESDLKNIDEKRRQRFFLRSGEGYQVVPELRQMVEFRRHDLLRQEFEPGFQLILCRNVVIYFTDAAKDVLYRRFYDALAPEGVLFIGSTECIFGAKEIGFETFSPFFYRKSVPQPREAN
jgi:chemotaxis protein methyltransferase CheR